MTSTPHPSPPPQGGEPFSPSHLAGEGWGGGVDHALSKDHQVFPQMLCQSFGIFLT